ncbi:MAG: class I SAM-dependent methyltransferase [Actinomycetota bacterium]
MDAESNARYLTPEQARGVYNRIGRFQDWQAIYESRALQEVVRFGTFTSSRSVFEFGCGTGAFAARLLKTCLPADCRYAGLDVSPRMIRLATSRLKPWAGRAGVRLSDGSPHLQEADASFDHFVSNYVFDLLSPAYASVVLAEAHRILGDGGKLCLVSLTHGPSLFSRIFTKAWERCWRWKPALLGGCRPVELRDLLSAQDWSIEHQSTVVSFGVPSEVIVASRRAQ